MVSSSVARLRAPSRPYRVAVVVLLVTGVLCLLVELLSPSLVLWTGERVDGTNDGGIVYYTVDGQERTLDAKGPAPAQPVPTTVYADPDDSTKDRIVGPEKWFDAAFVLAPFVATVVVAAVGSLRRGRATRGATGRTAAPA